MNTIDLLPDTVNLNQIEEGLYLGNLTAALDVATLSEFRISHILTVDSKPLQDEILEIPGLAFMYIGVNDMSNSDLLSHFDETFQFISEGQKKGNVLVHCYFGVSRSATLVTAFLMKKYNIPFLEALQRVKKKRAVVGPNGGFMSQLLLYENLKNQVDKRKYSFKIYRLEKAVDDFQRGNFLAEKYRYSDILESELKNDQMDVKITIKCRDCRQTIAKDEHFLPHIPGKVLNWEDKSLSESIGVLSVCLNSLFVLPLPCFKDVFQKPLGKILCFKCGQKLGSFNWNNGCTCPCGSISNPGFCFNSSKVDVLKQYE